MLDKTVCHNPNCRKIPIITIIPDTSYVNVFCNISRQSKIIPVDSYLKLCKPNNQIKCICQKDIGLNSFYYYCNKCEIYLHPNCYFKRKYCKNHDVDKLPKPNVEDKCSHGKNCKKYCNQCNIFVCEECLKNNNNHKNHDIKEFKEKTQNDLNKIENILNIQEQLFKKEKEIIDKYFNEMENILKLKRMILQTYMNDKKDINSSKNLDNLNLKVNSTFMNEIKFLCNNNDINTKNSQKVLSLQHYNEMHLNKDNAEIRLDLNINEGNEAKNINKKNYLEDIDNKNINFGKKCKLVKKLNSEKDIYSILVLNTGNLALGLSSGLIQIYKPDLGTNKINDLNPLLEITKFKGRKINYLYQLKDKSLLCCTYSKIHHIRLEDNDTKYEYLGKIVLSSYELPKKIIELNNNFIVALLEKKRKKVNVTKTKCILKIFRDITSNNNNISNNNQNEEDYYSDYMSENSVLSSDWQSIYSNEEEQSSFENESINMMRNEFVDENIKVYKKFKNIDKLFFCTIFRTIDNNFVATSNNNFNGGDNVLLFYRISKIEEPGRGYNIISDSLIEKLPCSQNVNSICFLDNKNIIVALQNYQDSDFDGIAIVNFKEKKLEKIIGGSWVGALNLNFIFNRKIIFLLHNSRGNKKLNEFGIWEYKNTEKIKCENLCTITKGFKGCLEYKSNNNEKKYCYIVYNSNEVFILEIKLN